MELPQHPEDQPDILTDRQFAELEEEKRTLLGDCEFCNGSGYRKNSKMCSCLKKVMMKYRMLCSNIPREYHNASFDNFHNQKDPGFLQVKKYTEKLDNARREGIGLHIHTKMAGTGKTMLVSAVLLAAIEKGYYVWFTSLQQLMEDIKLGFNNEKQRKIIQWVMFHTDFLFIDELMKFQKTEWNDSKINDLIQRRVNEKLPILTTDNLSIDEMTSKYPDHLISRFSGTQHEITFIKSIDFRKEVKKKDLIKKLMGN